MEFEAIITKVSWGIAQGTEQQQEQLLRIPATKRSSLCTAALFRRGYFYSGCLSGLNDGAINGVSEDGLSINSLSSAIPHRPPPTLHSSPT